MSPLPIICNLYYGNANLNSCHYPQSCHNVSSSLFLQTSLANVYMTLIRTSAFTLFPSSSRPLPARDVAVQRKCFHWLDSRQFIPSMTIETENDEAVKVDFHYRLVLSVSCVYCVHVVGFSSCLAYTHAQVPEFCLHLCQIAFPGMRQNFGCRPTLLLKSNTLLKSLKSTTASRPRPA